MSLSSTAIASGIAALSISGVTVKDIAGIPDSVSDRSCPILFPCADGWQLGGNGEPSDGPSTFGEPTTRMWNFTRTYKYVYLHAPIGSARGLKDIVSGMTANADAILTAFTTLDLTGVDVQNVSITDFGGVSDPAGAKFYGFFVTITCRERLNNG